MNSLFLSQIWKVFRQKLRPRVPCLLEISPVTRISLIAFLKWYCLYDLFWLFNSVVSYSSHSQLCYTIHGVMFLFLNLCDVLCNTLILSIILLVYFVVCIMNIFVYILKSSYVYICNVFALYLSFHFLNQLTKLFSHIFFVFNFHLLG